MVFYFIHLNLYYNRKFNLIFKFDKVIKDLNICGEELLFITDGSNGIRQSLFPECTKKDIILPNYYHSFIDIRKQFQKYSAFQSKINNLDEILNRKISK
jgi:hypothetical protein